MMIQKMTGIFLLLLIHLTGQAQGIQFSDAGWEKALAGARAENKLVFLDAYASWCAPCQQMALTVFPDQELGNFFNAHFINLQMNMEKGTGPAMASRYQVHAYPTLLFFNGEGEMVHRITGFHSAEELLAAAQIALDPARRFGTLKKRFLDGERDARFLHDYTLASFQAQDEDYSKAADAYMSLQENWGTPGNREFIMMFIDDAYSSMFEYLLKNRKDFEKQFGREVVVQKIHNTIINSAFRHDRAPDFSVLEKLYYQAFPDIAGKLFGQFQMNYYDFAQDMEKFAQAAVRYYEKYPSKDPEELNHIAWNFYTHVDDREMLETALKWAKKSVRLQSEYYNNDTLAALYYRLGKKKPGMAAARQAIELARKQGHDYSDTEILLRELERL